MWKPLLGRENNVQHETDIFVLVDGEPSNFFYLSTNCALLVVLGWTTEKRNGQVEHNLAYRNLNGTDLVSKKVEAVKNKEKKGTDLETRG